VIADEFGVIFARNEALSHDPLQGPNPEHRHLDSLAGKIRLFFE
jgi:hypothetical protein